MAHKIIESRVHIEDAEACAQGLQNEIVVVCDTPSDLTAVGVNWYPMSVAIIVEPFTVKILNASRVWKDKTSGGNQE